MLSKEIMLVLSEKQLQGLIDIDELIRALKQTHIQDVAAANLVYRKVLERNIGTKVEI